MKTEPLSIPVSHIRSESYSAPGPKWHAKGAHHCQFCEKEGTYEVTIYIDEDFGTIITSACDDCNAHVTQWGMTCMVTRE